MAQEVIITGIDVLLDYVKKKGKVNLKDAAKAIKYPESVVEDWASILDEEHLISIEYKFTKTFLVSKAKEKVADKREIRSTAIKGALKKGSEDKKPTVKIDKERKKESGIEVGEVIKKRIAEVPLDKKEQKEEAEKKKKFSFFSFAKKKKEEKEIPEDDNNEETIDEDVNEEHDSQELKKDSSNIDKKLRSLQEMMKKQQQQIDALKKNNEDLKSHEKKLIEDMKVLHKKIGTVPKSKVYNARKPIFSMIGSHLSSGGLSKQHKNEMMNLQRQMTSLRNVQKSHQEQLKKINEENVFLKKQEIELKNKLASLKRPRSIYSEIKKDMKKRRLEKESLRLQQERKLEIQEKKDRLFDYTKEALQRKKLELQNQKKELEEKRTALENKREEIKKQKEKNSGKEVFKSFVQNMFGNSDRKPKLKQKSIIEQSESAEVLKTKSYQELITEANKELEKKGLRNNVSEALKIPVYKHEPFAERLVKTIELEEKRLEKSGNLSKTKIKSMMRKRQRIKEKLKKLNIEKHFMHENEFANKKDALNHVLDKINNLLNNEK